jgi:hypothetical protein
MKNKNKVFTYKNKIILKNGSSVFIKSIRYIKNYQFYQTILKKKKLLK